MAKVRIKATKMTDAKVDFISMVERGANRSPIKIIKQENGMSAFSGLDISNLFRAKKSEKPEVFGFVTMKSEHTDHIASEVAAAGFVSADPVTMEDNSVVFKQGDTEEGTGSVVRLNDHLAVIIKNAKLYDMDIVVNGKSFKEEVEEQGFYPSVEQVMSDLTASVYEMVAKAESPQAAALAVASIFSEAGQYAQSLVSNLPAAVFKLEQSTKSFKSEPQAEVAVTEEVKKEEPEAQTLEVALSEESVKAVEAVVAQAVEAVEKAEKTLTPEDVSNIVAPQVEGVTKTLIEKMESLVGALTQTVQKSAEAMDAKFVELSASVAQTKELAQKADSAVKGAVIQGADTADHSPVQKREMRAVGREIDTAYNKDARTRHRRS